MHVIATIFPERNGSSFAFAHIFSAKINSELDLVGWGEWGVVEYNWGVNVVWVCEPVFRNLPLSYTWPLKIDRPCHILDRPKC